MGAAMAGTDVQGAARVRTLTCFVSAVSKEFEAHRLQLREDLSGIHFDTKIQENFSNSGGPLLLELDACIQNCDAVIHLVGRRCGAVASANEVAALLTRHPRLAERKPLTAGLPPHAPCFSFTQWEAYLADFHGRKLFISRPKSGATDVGATHEDPDRAEAEAQDKHLDRLEELGKFPRVDFTSPENLAKEVLKILFWVDKRVEAGFPRGYAEDLTHLPEVFATELFGRERELKSLHSYWDDPSVRLVVLGAMGGAGKTALAMRFVERLLDQPKHAGAEAAFAWSFYSQGASDQRQSSSDPFFDAAFRFFGAARPPIDAHAKGTELAKLIQKRRTLLFLDGLEPLQYATPVKGQKSGSGRLRDKAVEALLEALAGESAGLCLITTRQPLKVRSEPTSVKHEPLKRLPLMAGVALLLANGVEPSHRDKPMPSRAALQKALGDPKDPNKRLPDDYDAPHAAGAAVPSGVARDLVRAVEELRGHALALTLVARLLAENHRGDIRRIDLLPPIDRQAEEAGDPDEHDYRDPFRVMRMIEFGLIREIRALGKESRPADCAAGRDLALLYFLGLHEQPVSTALLPAVFAAEGAPAPDAHDVELAATDLGEEDRSPNRAPAAMLLAKAAYLLCLRRARVLTDTEKEAVREARRRVILRSAVAELSARSEHESKRSTGAIQLSA